MNTNELSTQANNNIAQIKELLSQITYDNDYGNVINTEKAITKIRNKIRVLINLLPIDKKSLNLNVMDGISRLMGGLVVEEGKKSIPNGPSIGGLTDEGMW